MLKKVECDKSIERDVRRGLSKEMIEKVCLLYDAGVSVSIVAKTLNLAEYTVRKYAINKRKPTETVERRVVDTERKKNLVKKLFDSISVGDIIVADRYRSMSYVHHDSNKSIRFQGRLIYKDDNKIVLEIAPHKKTTYTRSDFITGHISFVHKSDKLIETIRNVEDEYEYVICD